MDKNVLIFVDDLPIGKRLKVKRAQDNLTLRELSDHIACPLSTLSDIENGKRNYALFKHSEAIHKYLYREIFEDGVLIETLEEEV